MIFHEYMIAYDIEDNKIRRKVFKKLESYGLRNIQFSIFWGFLQGPEIKSIQRFIEQTIAETDKVIFLEVDMRKHRSLGYSSEYFNKPNGYEII